jgi:hypothetical protein
MKSLFFNVKNQLSQKSGQKTISLQNHNEDRKNGTMFYYSSYKRMQFGKNILHDYQRESKIRRSIYKYKSSKDTNWH